MWWKLLFNSFRRDRRRKLVAMSAVALATCLATFLLNWSLNLGDKIQRELRAYGSNIIIVPQGDSLPVLSDDADAGLIMTDQFLRQADIAGIQKIFWKNQILSMVLLLPQTVQYRNSTVQLVGSEFGETEPVRNFAKGAPYLQMEGSWPAQEFDAVCGSDLCEQFGWTRASEVKLEHNGRQQIFRITGIVSSGGME